jgi:hypothetical protein
MKERGLQEPHALRHRGVDGALDARFDRRVLVEGPYFFCDLDDIREADEQAAIDAKVIRATGLRYAASGRVP